MDLEIDIVVKYGNAVESCHMNRHGLSRWDIHFHDPGYLGYSLFCNSIKLIKHRIKTKYIFFTNYVLLYTAILATINIDTTIPNTYYQLLYSYITYITI